MTEQHQTIVVKDGDPGAGVIAAIVAIVVVLVLGWYFLMGPGAPASEGGNDTDVTVALPSVAPAPS